MFVFVILVRTLNQQECGRKLCSAILTVGLLSSLGHEIIWSDLLGFNISGAVASWLVRSTPERAVRVRALAADIVLCSWARHF